MKGLLQAVANAGHPAEHHDTIQKLLGLSLLERVPVIQAGWIPIEPGVFEHIHANLTQLSHQKGRNNIFRGLVRAKAKQFQLVIIGIFLEVSV